MTEILIVKCLSDNYAYIHSNKNGDAFVVDPSEAGPVIDVLNKHRLNLKFILNTHHHFDHVGGNFELKEKYECKIVGSKKDFERIPGIDIKVSEGDIWNFDEHNAQIIEIPGHTTGHIAFYFESLKLVFTGDTLFSLGCGRLFEGSPEMMWKSLTKLRDLPDETKIYCGHEYTLSNGNFISSIYPSDEIESKIDRLKSLNKQNIPSIPSTIGDEKRLNIFLKADDEDLINSLGLTGKSPEEVFGHIRNLKDSF
jgi:hydroxyacylglutathione hydrolase